MRYALITDTETQGDDPTRHGVIEVATAVFDLRHRVVVEACSTLLPCDTNEAQAINGIPPEATRQGLPPELDAARRKGIWDGVRAQASRCDLILAHNAEFDRAFVEIGADGPLMGAARAREEKRQPIPWVCTCDDIAWPRQHKHGQGLVSLALAHGLGVGSAHRALDDVLLLARLIARACEMGLDLERALERALRPKTKVISLARFEDKEIVKQHGFRWDPAAKEWWRLMPIEDCAALPFKVKPAEGRR